ncbi:regulator of chromosome condensation [Drechmeria coniospora]|uniref:Regulator of chromosome condensation n=1 Tax=Drechmeria coniospora TaxID=98403 RepID=A0A151GRW7_DRECN|nr:regulator of chromosome condensation [Drechmeria coniospora]KYK59849.1 regulator of chromosome condensation [Drechmeria coniospora]
MPSRNRGSRKKGVNAGGRTKTLQRLVVPKTVEAREGSSGGIIQVASATSSTRTASTRGTGDRSEIRIRSTIGGGPRRRRTRPSPSGINQTPTNVLQVFVFGCGENGELGLGSMRTTAHRPCANPFLKPGDPFKLHVVRIACGGMHTVALTADNMIVTWGVNDNDALGRNTDWNGGGWLDFEPDGENGELNPFESTPTAIPAEAFPLDTTFVDVAAGDSCSFALTATGLVYGWGTFRDPDGREGFGYAPNGTRIQRQATPTLVVGLENITQITCGANHALALDLAGNIWAWGSGHQNQFGRRLFGRHKDGLRPHPVRWCRKGARYIACGEYHCFAVDRKDDVWGWGLNSFGEAGDATTAGTNSALLPCPRKIQHLCGRGVTVLDGGAHHSAAVTADGQCLVWGRIDSGQLGIDFTASQLQDPTLIRCDARGRARICLWPTVVPNIGKGVHVACGSDHTIFVNEHGHAFASGFGSEGQLGLGSDADVCIAQRIASEDVKGRFLTWAGAGGQFSVVAGPA